uniref:Guanine nucleotide-binding protein subunit gamma n=4 Tax=Salmoninae TaxID=504568 RepID=A0A4W5R9R1_9TELE
MGQKMLNTLAMLSIQHDFCHIQNNWKLRSGKSQTSVSSPSCSSEHSTTRMKGDTPVNSTMSVGQARKLVEQLKIEASFCRIKVSKAAADLMAYCDTHAIEDPLITPVPTSENPFREKKLFCALL